VLKALIEEFTEINRVTRADPESTKADELKRFTSMYMD